MAATDLKTFIENRLLVLDPATDISPGSPAQTQFVEPLIAYLGTDPMETDIQSFILDRFSQEYPDLYAGDPGVISDTFIKPLTLMLEPFKREIQAIKKNQSLKDPTVLSDDDADALVANVFDERTQGGLAGGVARIFFTNPTNTQVEINSRFFTASGLNFFPSTPVSISAEEMVFNRSGGMYFMDVTVQAEQAGAEYNIPKNTLAGVSGVFGVIKVDNPRDFGDGATKIDTPSFVAQARGSLTERSMVTRRGGTAILSQTFRDTVRAVQIIGAGDIEMQRDIMVATSPGHAWMTGRVGLYQKMAYVRCRTVDDASTTPTVQVGDQVYVYLSHFGTGSYPGAPQTSRTIRLTVAEVLIGPMLHPSDAEFQVSFLIRFKEAVPAIIAADVLTGKFFEGGLIKRGTVTVSSIPGAALVDPLSINNQEVHVLGHSDVYVRPVLQVTSTVTLNSLSADPGIQSLQRTSLSTTLGSNVVSDTAGVPLDFAAAGVLPGDFLIIESGGDIGTYAIRKIVASTLYLSANLSVTASSIRYRIIKDLTINPFNPRILKLPFGSVPNNDLQTLIGSNIFHFTGPSSDLLNYGVKIGDVVKVSGSLVNTGLFTITGFTDGQHALVDRAAAGSESGLTYEIYTPLNPVSLPLVRLKELMILDSAKQNTGVTIPPADPVAVVPASHITSAQIRAHSEKPSGFILPDLTQFMTPIPAHGTNHASIPAGRYSSGFLSAIGGYGSVVFDDATKDEVDYTPELFGKCSFFVATAEDLTMPENFPPIAPKPGDALTLKSGPNKGDYLIKDVIKFRYKKASGDLVWAYFIQIYGTFPVDVIAQLTAFLNQAAGAPLFAASAVPVFNYTTTDLIVPGYLQTTIYASLGTKLNAALTAYGITPPSAVDLQAFIDSMTLVDYSWGDPARGVLRTFFSQPTLFQQHTASHLKPTTYSFKTSSGEILQFRADPNRYTKQEMIPPRLSADADPLAYPRDLVGGATSATFTSTTRATVFNLGIQPGDVLSVHEEFLLLGSTGTGAGLGDLMCAVKTVYNSTQVTFANAPTPFTPDMTGGLLFIEEGADKGGYRIVKVLDSKNLILDRPLTVTTPAVSLFGSISQWGYDAGTSKNILRDATNPFLLAHVGNYLTIYGMNSAFQGSYKIKSFVGIDTVELERVGFGTLNFPSYSVGPGNVVGYWVMTTAPAAAPTKTGTPTSGTELYGLRPVRIYRSIPLDFTISAVDPSTTASDVTIPTGLRLGVNQPYRIYRNNLRRVTPYEMSLNSISGMFYFDTDVMSLGPGEANNLPIASYLTIDDGTFESYGYKHLVDDDTLTYSTKETGKLFIPSTILPTNSPDSLDNFISLAGSPLQISYERGSIVQAVQDFLDSPEDRVTVANMLARHFLPSYVSFDASYTGGSAPGVIAKDIISFIDNLAIEVPLDVSELQHLIENRGGNIETPTTVFILTHDWDRRRWAEFSSNKLGGTTTLVPYNGTPRVGFFVSGPDVSGQATIPLGERILLTRQ